MAEVVTAVLVNQLGQVLKEILVPPLVDRVKRLISVRDDVEQIKDDLEAMQAVLKDADQQQSSQEHVRNWVRQLRNIAYETEDLLDELVFQHGRSSRRGSAGSLSILRHIGTWNNIANGIQNIRRRIKDLSERRNKFSLASTGTGASSSTSTTGHGFAEKSEIVGIDKPMAKLKTLLLQGMNRREVIAVHGKAGVGKTTLVRQVYGDSVVKEHFEYRAFIVVTYPFKIAKLLSSMWRQFSGAREERRSSSAQEASSTVYHELVQELRDMLRKKRYVAFLDNISTGEEDAWSQLKYALPENNMQSRIVVTTQSRETAARCAWPLGNVFLVSPLSGQDAWTLFCKKAFTSYDDDGCPKELIPTARRILVKCGGLPAAIVTIGELLSTKSNNPLEWKSVSERLGSGFEGGGYNNLSFDLKPCYLYFGIYPLSHEIKRAELIRQWVAEGFIDPVHDDLLEDISYYNLKQLTEKNLVHVSKEDCFERVESCEVDELDRELILLKSRDQSFHTSMELPSQARRLAIYPDGQNRLDFIERLYKIRSLFLFGPNSVAPSLEKFSSLKVLSLHRIKLDSFPSSIVNLFHLRYLCLRGTNIAKIPKSIQKLKNLQTLDLKDTRVSKLPKQIRKLEDLRHLFVSHADGLRGAKLPTKLGKLRSMQKLHILDVVKGGKQLKELGKLTQLKKLSITSVRREDGTALSDSIMKMSRIQSLTLNAVGSEDLDIDSLSTPSKDLRSIKLTGRLTKLPMELVSYCMLFKLHLSRSQLSGDPLQALHSLLNLVDLRMFVEAYAGETLEVISGGFRKLKTLVFGDFKRLKTIIINEKAMPNLEFFEVLGCQRIISFTGLTHLQNLKIIRLPQRLQTIISRKEIQHIQPVSKWV